jgi:radical SAM protein with 4Fe4S-binding SPASM domain
MEFNTQIINGHYLVNSVDTGAMSLFSPAEYLAFNSIINSPEKERKYLLNKLLTDFGCNEEQINRFTDIFLRKLNQQGWFRESFGEVEYEKLQMVYFSITTKCNLSCLYCYIGDDRRDPDHIMPYNDAVTILTKIKSVNPNACIAVTGGEPFTHPDIFRILDFIEKIELKIKLGTNAVFVDESCAKRLKGYKNLAFVQASLDGMTPETHAITRGNSFEASMKGINHLINQKVPLAIAPTLHEGNIHEIEELARFTYRNGAIFSPNHLRKFPQATHVNNIFLKPDTLRKCIVDTFSKMNQEFDIDLLTDELNAKKCEDLPNSRCRYVCSNAWTSIDIDWNGDVFPCHLLREKDFVIGNILKEEFPVILERGRKSKTRVKSYEIPKCKKCPFVATCGGGCRSSAFYTNGTLAAEDEYCEILYKFEVEKMFYKKGIAFQFPT